MNEDDVLTLFRMVAIALGGVVLIFAVSRALRKDKPKPRVEWPDNVVQFKKQEFLETRTNYQLIHKPSRRIH